MAAIAAPLIGAGISGIGSLVGSGKQANAIKDASAKQLQATQESNALQKGEFDTQQQNIAPWIAAGSSSLSKLSGMPDFAAPTADEAAATPGYQFSRDEGLKALQRNEASTGITGGAAAKAAERYGTGLADSTYNDVYSRALETYGTNRGTLLSLAGLGQAGVSQAGAAGTNYANQVGSNLQNLSNSQGAAGLSLGNIYSGQAMNLGQIGSNLFSQLYKPNNNSSYASWGDQDAG